jgi:3-methyladenine DNA glycosylase Tag
MQEQATEENIYRLERLFENRDSIKIVRKQVEKYEQLVKEQTEKIEQAMQNSKEVERLKRETERLKTIK